MDLLDGLGLTGRFGDCSERRQVPRSLRPSFPVTTQRPLAMSRHPSREESLFADALAQPPADRGAFLAKACGANVDLLAHLVALVAAHEEPGSVLEPLSIERINVSAEEKPGDAIGRFKLLQKIGEGGCGVVWMAEQEEPCCVAISIVSRRIGHGGTTRRMGSRWTSSGICETSRWSGVRRAQHICGRN